MIYKVPAGYTITATVTEGNASIKQVEDSTVGAVFTSSVSYGPYMVDRSFVVSDNATVSVDAVTYCPSSLVTYGAGAPDDAAKAALNFNPVGDDNGLTLTAKYYGTEGNNINITYVDPGANDASLSVSVFRYDITVSLATDGSGTITSTAAEIKAAIEASVEASKLVTVAIYTADDGEADDGSGVVTAMAKDNLESGAGTSIGVSFPGGLYIDTTNANVYRNSGTQSAPAWTQLGDVS